ncbi:hypothetical protein EW146_g7284 [Bondarzewia mesenterica]|uniref:Rho-GAP domain-containing protein n=1 Tax=Bondarzewia mesenterica TaxID=1095465 RepID=A0A4S4LLC8_9AGAM|nr:hypothetical protein EW146_g7284 [Bondarzewia mesenterica]
MASSVDNLPAPRPSLDGPQSGPIPLFDFHLRILTDSYISFFQERKRIEELYVESLTRLHHKAKAIDTYLDDHIELNTTRRAWNEVRDNVERGTVHLADRNKIFTISGTTETQARQAFLNTLLGDVLTPLANIRETQDRTRKRVKEELKESASMHADFADNQLPKLKRQYLRKCQEVEDYKAASMAASMASPSGASSPTHEGQVNVLIPSRSNPSLPSRPSVTSPQPLRPLDRRPSGSVPRNRSPSTSTALQDLAHQGKRQLNQLITFLDKSGNMKEGLVGRGQDNALRSVRAKREADEADKEYRKGVHWLETLRLRRVKTLEAGYTSLERFVLESAETVKKVLVSYTDNMFATCATQTQLASHVRTVVEQISAERDTARVSAHIPRSLAMATPKPVLYYNYHVGECRDLIFGVSMVNYATARGLGERNIPKIVRICIQEIDQRGLYCEGIYRVSGRLAVVQELQHKIERDEREFRFNPVTDDVYSVSSLLKLYLRELPEPVFKFPLQDRLQHTEDLAEHASNGFVLLRSKMRRLPAIHRATLKALVEHLARVAANSEKNKMDAKNLAIVFGGVIFGEDEIPQGADLLSVQAWKDTLMEDLIENAQVLFDDRAPPSSPPLPPAPAGEPVPVYSYGSAHTKVSSVPVPDLPPRVAENDFAPQLPPRPTNSIHPSARHNVMPADLPRPPTRPRLSPPPLSNGQKSDGQSPVQQEMSEKLDNPISTTPTTPSSASTPASPRSPTFTTSNTDSASVSTFRSPPGSSNGHT